MKSYATTGIGPIEGSFSGYGADLVLTAFKYVTGRGPAQLNGTYFMPQVKAAA